MVPTRLWFWTWNCLRSLDGHRRGRHGPVARADCAVRACARPIGLAGREAGDQRPARGVQIPFLPGAGGGEGRLDGVIPRIFHAVKAEQEFATLVREAEAGILRSGQLAHQRRRAHGVEVGTD